MEKKNVPLTLSYSASKDEIRDAMEVTRNAGPMSRKSMTRFQVMKAILDVDFFAREMYEYAHEANSWQALAEFLSEELCYENMKGILSAAKTGTLLDISGSKAEHSENVLKAIDCMAQHVKSLLKQSTCGQVASFGDPCASCLYQKSHSCTLDWLTIMDPILKYTSIRFSLDRDEIMNQAIEAGDDTEEWFIRSRLRHKYGQEFNEKGAAKD